MNAGGELDEAKASNVSVNFTNDTQNSKTKVLATLGLGNINIGNTEDSDTKMLNRDIENNEVDIYDVESHQGLSVELDTNMLTEKGRQKIADDLKKSKVGFYDVAKDIITSDSLTILDSFSHQGNKVDMYEGVQNAIKNDKILQEKLADPNLTKDEKNSLLTSIASSVAKELDIKLADVSTISTDKQTEDGEEIMGGFHEKTGDIAVNDKNINSTGEAVNTLGHELAHALDAQRGETREGTTASGQSYSEEYANIMGAGLEDYAEFAMYNYTDDTLATTNTHNGMKPPTSVFDPNYDQATQNFENRVDAGEVDYLVSGVYNKKNNILTISDNDTGEFVQVEGLSGLQLNDSIPIGNYEILDFAGSTKKFRLDAIDSHSRDDINQNAGNRNEFRLHNWGLGINLGCISVTECNGASSGPNWDSVSSTIINTQAETVIDHVNPYQKATNPIKKLFLPNKPSEEPITKYGTLEVID